MKALQVTDNPQEKLRITDVPMPGLQPGQVLVKLKAVALNHRDQWIRENKYPNLKFPSILGSDGCGVVEKVHDDSDKQWLGREVIINPNNNWGNNPEFQSPQYHILGMPSDGTFAEYIAVNADRLHEKPAHLSAEQAAAIPLGGLTAYRATITQGGATAGQNVLISGVGGGVAQFAFQFALAAGATVYVTSGNPDKLAKAKDMGAAGGANYRDADWSKKLMEQAKGFNVIVDSAGGEGFAALVKMLRPAGRLVFYGATQGLPSSIDLFRSFFNQLRIQGSTMGNDREFADMVEFISRHRIVPVIDSVRPFDRIISAFDEMKEGTQFGKLVITL